MIELVASVPKLKLLRYLCTRDGAHTGRQLARAVGLDPKSAAVALRELTDGGLVRRRRAGQAYLYSVNSESYLISEALKPLFAREQGWLRALAAEVREVVGRPAESIVLYGSWARGQAGAQSDIDLLVIIRPEANPSAVEEKLNSHRLRLAERFDHPLSFLVMTRSTFKKKVQGGDRIAMDIAAQGQVLAGKSLAELVAHG